MILLNGFYHTEETSNCEKAGVDYSLDDCILKPVAFLNIDMIEPHKSGKKYSNITSGGMTITVDMPFKDLLELIADTWAEPLIEGIIPKSDEN